MLLHAMDIVVLHCSLYALIGLSQRYFGKSDQSVLRRTIYHSRLTTLYQLFAI